MSAQIDVLGPVAPGSPWRRRQRWVAAVVGVAVSAALLVALPGTPAQAKPEGLRPQVEKLDDDGGEVRGRAWPRQRPAAKTTPAPTWPAAGRARAVLPSAAERRVVGDVAVRAGGLPVWVRRDSSGGRAPESVDVELLDRSAVPRAFRDGLLMRLRSSEPRTSSTAVAVDYSAFRHAYGGDWSSRLKLWSVPECALRMPDKAACQATPLRSRNDAVTSTVTGELSLAAGGASMVALAAEASGASGDFTATPLSPSATWSAGGSTGGFTWTYPMRVPPSVTGQEPTVGLSYSSASVDGRSSATNNQPSWVGEGFEYSPGFIERRYVACSDDMAGSANNSQKTGDLCWRSDNATMSLNGSGTELIFESGKGWHGRSENGSKVEKLTGGGNGDNDGEYWKVTGIDGTQYFFGRHNLPGHTAKTNSTNTVRVYGNHPGEQCSTSTFAGSHCNQAWRWNLDYVVDTRGNTISYWYDRETNKYAANATSSTDVAYVRASPLARIDYGTWDRGTDDRSVTPTAQVLFTTADRCLSSCATHDATRWPDVPWDQECEAGATSCGSNYSPTFWSTKRLSKITTRVWDTTRATPGWQDVDSWTLTHTFPPPGDGNDHAGLWLDKIVHAGHVGGTVTMPPVTFDPVSLPNRVLTKTNTSNNWHRIGNIITETGAKVQVTYSLPECTSGNLPAAAHTNTKLCYPVIGPDPQSTNGADHTEWWHKYVVRQVSESDIQLAGGHQTPTKNTYYTYVGTPAWHYADDDGLTKPKYKTWNQFRGYATVKTRVGDTAGQQTLTATTYLRGMHRDRAAPSGGTRTVTVPASLGGETVNDEDQFAGMIREQVIYNGVETKPVSKTVNVPWMSPAIASRTINGDTVTARFTNTKTAYSATALGVDGDRGWRTTRVDNTFHNSYGTVEQTSDQGDTGKSGDEKCVSYVYKRNTGKNILATVKQATVTALTCGTPPTAPEHIVSDTRNTHDGASSPETAPVYGAVTKVEQLKDWTAAGGTVWRTASQTTLDAFGRQLTATDVRGNTTTTAYTPPSGGPVTSIRTTSPSPYNWIGTTDVSPYWGTPVKTTDPNGRVTDVEHDALGRVAKVWEVGWLKSRYPNSPSGEYTYHYSATRSAYPYVVSKELHAGGGYHTTYQLFDGLLRPRQTQVAAVGGGRVVSDIIYDDLGRAEYSHPAHAEPGDPSGGLWWEPQWSLRALNRTVYDNADRPVAEIFLAGDGATNLIEKWRTTTAYEGDLTKVTPPSGGTPITTKADARGRTVELKQHTTAQGVDGVGQSTTYTYNPKGQLVKVADPAGNQWTYSFDIQGRQVVAVDPDKGTTTSVFNDYGDLVQTTDARGEVLAYSYDQLGRKTALYDDSVTAGTKRAEWKYDRLYSMAYARGQLTEAIRYDNGLAYRWRVANFNARYQPSGISIVVPFEELGLGGTYGFSYSYADTDGTPTAVGYPGGGGLGGELVTTRYDQMTGLPTELETNYPTNVANYVASQTYTAYGEPTVTTRKIGGGVYVQDAAYYDEATRRVTRTTVKPETASGPVSDRSYTYDPAGNITSIAEAPQVGQAETQCFRYDALRRLTSAWTPKAGVACSTNPTVGNLGGPAPYWQDWTFDAVGNRLTQTAHAAAGDTKQTYTVPVGGPGVVRPHAVTAMKTEMPGQAPVTRLYGYDDAGNTTTRPGASSPNQALTWDAEGRVTKIVEDGAETSFVYDAAGGRLLRRDATGTTLYLPGMEIRRENGANTATRYYTFAGKLVASRTQSMDLTWLYDDHQGTQQTSVHAYSQQVTVRRQTPYGEPRGTQPAWPNQKGFVGGDVDPTGLTHIGARQYDSGLGRFISVDPIMNLADPQQWSAYSYANNNPITFSDPTGMIPIGDSEGKIRAIPTEQKPRDSRTDEEKRRHRGEADASRRFCPTCLKPGQGATPEDPFLSPVEWAEIWFNTHPTRLMPLERNIAFNSWLCFYFGEICDARKEAQREADKQLVLDLIGVTDAKNCLDGKWTGCAWTALSLPGAGKVLKLIGKLVDVSKAGKAGKAACPLSFGLRSFSGDTRVLMADGTTKAIRDVEVGDRVMATDPEAGESGPREVTHVWVHPDTVVDLEIDGKVITTTEDHPFWNAADKEWQRVDRLDRHDELGGRGLGPAPQVGKLLLPTARTSVAYNLTVADIHTYYVLAGTTPVLVHNCGGARKYPIDLLRDKFKHAADFGVYGPKNGRNQAMFSAALEAHIKDPYTVRIDGTYRNTPVTHYLNLRDGTNSMYDPQGNWISGWKLNDQQFNNVSMRGTL